MWVPHKQTNKQTNNRVPNDVTVITIDCATFQEMDWTSEDLFPGVAGGSAKVLTASSQNARFQTKLWFAKPKLARLRNMQ
jgi:hypothetical protein